ncbi:MAG: NAD(P)/FAD-dependent oxidoreductase [Fastidiosipilaceae bacterium]|jgi:thioredoxin reductase (NADPH)
MEKLYDVIIVGAGPAGMTAGIYVSRARLDALMIEGLFPGGKMANTSIIDNYPGIDAVDGPDLAAKMYEHSTRFGLDQEFATVTSVHVREDGIIEVSCSDRVFLTRSVIIASGTVNRLLGIPGENEYAGKGIAYCAVCDGSLYKDEEVIVIGGGNTAYEDADYLTRFAKKVTLVLRRDVPRAEKYLQEVVKRNNKIEVRYNLTPQEFLGDGNAVTGVRFSDSKTGEDVVIASTGVFPMVGLVPKTDCLAGLDILTDEGFIKTDSRMATDLPGIYAAGDVRDTVLRQIVTAAGDGAIAAQAVIAYLDLT